MAKLRCVLLVSVIVGVGVVVVVFQIVHILQRRYADENQSA